MEIKVTNLGKVCITPRGIWDSNKKYERLDLVYCRETKSSYVAVRDVPIDINICNKKYWQIVNASDFIQIVEYIDYKFEKIIEYIDNKTNDEIYEQLEAMQAQIDGMNTTINTFTTDINNQMQEFYDNQDDKFNTFKDDINDIVDARVANAIEPVITELHEYSDANKQESKNYTDTCIANVTNNIDDIVDNRINNNEVIDNINQTVGQHTTQIANMQSSINTLTSDVNILKTDVATAKADAAAAKSDAANAKSAADIAKSTADNAKSVADTAKATADNIKSSVDAVKSDVDTLKSDMSTAKSDINTLKSNVTTINSNIDGINSDISSINSEIDELKASAGDGTPVVSADNIKVIDLSGTVGTEATKLESLNDLTTENYNKLIDAINNDYSIIFNVNFARPDGVTNNQRVTAIQADIKGNYTVVSFIFNSYLTSVTFIGPALNSLYSEHIIDNTYRIDSANSRIDDIDTQIETIDTQITGINNQVTNLDSRVDTLQTQVDNIPAAGEVASTLEVLPIEVNLNPSNGIIRDIKTVFDISHFQRLFSAINANKSILLNVNVYEYDEIVSNDKIIIIDAAANESESTIYLEFLYNSVYYYLHITPLTDTTYTLRYKEIDNTSISRRLDTIDEQLTNIPDTTRYNYVMIDK